MQDTALNTEPPVCEVVARDLAMGERFGRLISVIQWTRRAIAPPGSWRERLVRPLYAPFLTALPANPFDPNQLPRSIQAELVTLNGTSGTALPFRPIQRMVVLKLDHIGDFVLGMRAMRQLRDGFPSAHMTLVCAGWNRGLAEKLGIFDEIVCLEAFPALNRDWSADSAALDAIYSRIADAQLRNYDLALDLRHDADTRPCLSRIETRYRAGFWASVEPGCPPLDLMLPVTEAMPTGNDVLQSLHAELRLQLLANAVVSTFASQPPHPLRSFVTPARAEEKKRYAVLAIGAGDPIRAWPLDRYAEVGRKLNSDHGLHLVVLGGSAEREDADRLVAMLAPIEAETAIDVPLVELPVLLSEATICVCNGSGLSHLAAAVGVPTVCILGGTTRMGVWHPIGPTAISLGGMTVCQPCGLRFADDCPFGVACLSVVKPIHVLAACQKLLVPGRPDDAMPATG